MAEAKKVAAKVKMVLPGGGARELVEKLRGAKVH
jgi:hypothetical protein